MAEPVVIGDAAYAQPDMFVAPVPRAVQEPLL